jgi:hypothetical protein
MPTPKGGDAGGPKKPHPGRNETDPRRKREYRESDKDAIDPHRTDDVKPTPTRTP